MWSAPADNGLPRRRSKTTDSDSTQRVPPLSFFLPTARSRGTTHAPARHHPRAHARAIATPTRRHRRTRTAPAIPPPPARTAPRRPSQSRTKAFARRNEGLRARKRTQSFRHSSAVVSPFERSRCAVRAQPLHFHAGAKRQKSGRSHEKSTAKVGADSGFISIFARIMPVLPASTPDGAACSMPPHPRQ